MNERLRRPALRFYGGKWVLAPWIIGHFPDHECYVEPYCGGASVLLRKERSFHEVMNDLDSDVVNFFECLRERPEELIRAISLTPFSRSEFRLASLTSAPPDIDPVERSRRFYIRASQSFGGPTATIRNGWKYNVTGASGRSRHAAEFADIAHLDQVVDRLKGVQIECDEALRVIVRYDRPSTLFYVDPPYLSGTRCLGSWKSGAYRHEMLNHEHSFLLDAIRRCRGMVVLSGYDSDLYNESLPGWKRVEKQAAKRSRNTSTEVLWLCPKTVQALEVATAA